MGKTPSPSARASPGPSGGPVSGPVPPEVGRGADAPYDRASRHSSQVDHGGDRARVPVGDRRTPSECSASRPRSDCSRRSRSQGSASPGPSQGDRLTLRPPWAVPPPNVEESGSVTPPPSPSPSATGGSGWRGLRRGCSRGGGTRASRRRLAPRGLRRGRRRRCRAPRDHVSSRQGECPSWLLPLVCFVV